MEESLSNEREDRLSELPESLILHILSFLPMRDVVSTTFLSKSWTNFWTIIPFRDFSEIISEEDDEPDSRNFVNRALIFGEGTKLLKLCLSSDSYQMKSLFPPLPSVVYLEVGVGSTELVEMVNLLEILPNLKMLVIKDHAPPDMNAENCLDFKTNLSTSFLLQLKIIEITSCFSKSSIFRCIEFLLKHGSMLEKLVIRVEWDMSRPQAHLLEITKTVLSMPRSSLIATVTLYVI